MQSRWNILLAKGAPTPHNGFGRTHENSLFVLTYSVTSKTKPLEKRLRLITLKQRFFLLATDTRRALTLHEYGAERSEFTYLSSQQGDFYSTH